MQPSMVAEVRRFNRLVTQRVGALDERFLARDRPLGQSRLLWEIGSGGAEARTLRARLDLDSGYLSRLLRALESDGLVSTTVSGRDARVRSVRLTEKGRAERALLERRSDELAGALLEPLSERQRERLVSAMREVELLLTATMIRIEPTDPADPDAQYCLRAYVAELDERFPGGFDPGRSISAAEHELRPPAGLLLLARLHGEPVGCGALKLHRGEPSEIKRMWVAPPARGLGLSRRLLAELEAHAARSHPVVRLETNAALVEAVALYRSSGYAEVAPFDDEPYADHWFEKALPG
jgi:DNA-binding MarR family transcriptional regulator/GNAT superfamily N-acetyltransferase